ncbi:hypothetical protein OROHE_019111 [Orobanche hederae]
MADDEDQSSIIPSLVDGLTPVQRMVLLCAFKNPGYRTVKGFCDYVLSQHSSAYYRYGKENLVTTLTDMAQNYPGSNNLNLYSQMSPFTGHLFDKSDEPLRGYLKKKDIEEHLTEFMPIIPMVLVNGSQAVGANYNPRDIIANIRRLIDYEPLVPMLPWYKWFEGTIRQDTEKTSYTTFGVVEDEGPDAPNTLVIEEMPIGKRVEEYAEFLEEAVLRKEEEEERFIEKYTRLNDGMNGTFELVISSSQKVLTRDEGFLRKLNLTTNLNTSNKYLLGMNDVKKRYDTPEQILLEFYHLRLKCYAKRKYAVFDDTDKALLQLEDQRRFLHQVLAGKIDPFQTEEGLYADLKEDKGYKALPKKEPSIEDYDYLLSMRTMCNAKYEKQLRAEWNKKKALRDSIVVTSPQGLWLQDLHALEVLLEEGRRDAYEEWLRKKIWIPRVIEEEEPSEDEEDEAEMASEEEEPSVFDFTWCWWSDDFVSPPEQDEEQANNTMKKKRIQQQVRTPRGSGNEEEKKNMRLIDGDDDDDDDYEEEGKIIINCG